MTLGLAFCLAACGSGYRDRSVPMASMAVFDPARFAGEWYEIARFPVPFQADCTDRRADYAVAGEGVLAVRSACRRDGVWVVSEDAARVAGPGRLKLRPGSVSADRWVLWVDEGYRTAVLGTPSGRAGWILNRTPEIPADRLRAARDVLDFNGYDLSELRMTPQGEAP